MHTKPLCVGGGNSGAGGIVSLEVESSAKAATGLQEKALSSTIDGLLVNYN